MIAIIVLIICNIIAFASVFVLCRDKCKFPSDPYGAVKDVVAFLLLMFALVIGLVAADIIFGENDDTSNVAIVERINVE